MNDTYVLREYYIRYLKEVRGVKDSTVKHYLEALQYISRYLVQTNILKESIYEISDITKLEIIREILYKERDFIELDKRGHQMYSAGLNNYYKFACGDNFGGLHENIQIMDVAMPVTEFKTIESKSYQRSSIIKIQAIKSVDYSCEINQGHNTFITESTNMPYVEGHHLIPLNKQKGFNNSLDVYANIICLCPNCHRFLHYGKITEKKEVLGRLYSQRKKRLANSGIQISLESFERLSI